MERAPGVADRLWAVLAGVAGLVALNGLLLAGIALWDGSPIPTAVGVTMLTLGVLGWRTAWHRTVWANVTKTTGLTYWEQQTTRSLSPGEVRLNRALLIGFPVLGGVVVASFDTIPWTLMLWIGGLVLVQVVTMPAHQRQQVLGKTSDAGERRV